MTGSTRMMASFRDVHQAAQRSPGIEMLWIVGADNSKITPVGVALLVKRQVIVKLGERLTL